MRKHWLAIGLVMAVAALTIGAIACSSSKKSSTATATTSSTTPSATSGKTPSSVQSEVTATLVEYKIVPNVTSVPAGTVTFAGQNIGGTDHTLVVLSTKLAALPTKADGSVDENSPDITILGKTVAIPAQQEKSLTVKLQPGNYLLICNVVQTTNGQTVSHYAKGMQVAFTITQ